MKNEKESGGLISSLGNERKKLARIGLLLKGSITEVRLVRDKGGSQKKYGPYYQWTFKEKGKTVTVNLTVAQKKAFQKAIDNNRKAEESLNKMRVLSRVILENSTSGLKRRRRTIEK